MMHILVNGFFSLWNTGLTLLPVIILLGALIFIHELGHFLVARWLGVRVEVFSLGFGKKILQWKKGSTTYCISLIPLGGYVKMFGHHFEPEKIAKEDQIFSFLHKSLPARTAIVLAGPLMNFILALVIVTIMTMIGQKRIHPVVGDIATSSVAAQVGFESGDRILSIEHNTSGNTPKTLYPTYWKEFNRIIINNPSQILKIQVKKISGKTKTLLATPSKQTILSEFGFEKQGGVINGLSPFTVSSVIGVADPLSPAGRAGLKTFDTVLSINQQPVRSWTEMKNILISHNSKTKLDIQFQREKSIQTTIIQPTTESNLAKQKWKLLGFSQPDLFISSLKNNSPAGQAGLKPADLLLKINHRKIIDWSMLVYIIKGFDPKNGPLHLEINRQGKIQQLSVMPKKQRVMRGMKEEIHYMLGIISGSALYTAIPAGGTYRASILNPLKAIWIAIKRIFKWCGVTGIYVKKIIMGEVSGKTLGGVIAIGQVAYKSYSLGLEYFLEMMALLSIQLFLLNLLPLPVLDGGHLFFYLIEYIKGTPISMNKMIFINYIGFVLLLCLFVFVTFNDLDRWMNIW